jgi:hypothetical protein
VEDAKTKLSRETTLKGPQKVKAEDVKAKLSYETSLKT